METWVPGPHPQSFWLSRSGWGQEWAFRTSAQVLLAVLVGERRAGVSSRVKWHRAAPRVRNPGPATYFEQVLWPLWASVSLLMNYAQDPGRESSRTAMGPSVRPHTLLASGAVQCGYAVIEEEKASSDPNHCCSLLVKWSSASVESLKQRTWGTYLPE